MRWSHRRARGDEQGAILVTTAVLLTAVASFAGLALGTAALYGTAQEGRTAADLSAAAGAASLPGLAIGSTPNPLGLPAPSMLDTPLGTIDATPSLPTLGTDFTLGVCRVVAQQFIDKRSPLTESWATGPVQCTPTVSVTDPALQRLVDCLQGAGSLASCAGQVESNLAAMADLPPEGAPVVAALEEATAYVGLAGDVMTAGLMARLHNLNAVLGGRLDPLVNALPHDGKLTVDLARIAPALVTPEVSVRVTQHVQVPGASLVGAGPITFTTDATARRAFKSAVAVPVVTPPGPDGGVVFDANPAIGYARDATLDAISSTADAVVPTLDQAFAQAGCAGTAGVAPCPSFAAAVDAMEADLRDIVDPPRGTAPDAEAVIQQAIASGEPILLAVGSYVVNPRQILGSTVYSLPGVAQLLPSLLFVPALDVVPMILSAGPLGKIIATPVDTVAAAARARGLFKARLVK
jgi:hypothetical protein